MMRRKLPYHFFDAASRPLRGRFEIQGGGREGSVITVERGAIVRAGRFLYFLFI